MGSIKLGTLSVDKMFVGDKEVDKVYLGNTLVYENAPVVVGESCTIANLGSENPTSVTFTKTANFPTESQAWEEVVIGNDHFAKFTPWYRKSVYNENNELIGMVISNQKEDADFVPYDCFLDESGNLLPYILIGRYCVSNTTTADSIDSSMATMTPSAGRALCRAKGTGYQMMDAAMQIFWRDLALACSETVNLNSGSGVASYLGLARMTEQYWWIDGLAQDSGTYLYSNKPSKYVDQPTTSTDGYSALSYTMPTNGNYCVKALGYDANHPTMNLPSANTGATSYTVYYCDRMYYASGNHPCRVNVGGAVAAYGLFYLYGGAAWSAATGVRLCYKPIS